jgi:hypothetical protein
VVEIKIFEINAMPFHLILKTSQILAQIVLANLQFFLLTSVFFVAKIHNR